MCVFVAAFNVSVHSGGLGAGGVGEAGIAKVDLQLPRQLSSWPTTLQEASPAATFEANPLSCDEESMIGHATIHTAILANPSLGPMRIAIEGCGAVESAEVKKLFRAQRLAAALSACRSNYGHSKVKHMACERAAGKRYAAGRASAENAAHRGSRTAERARFR